MIILNIIYCIILYIIIILFTLISVNRKSRTIHARFGLPHDSRTIRTGIVRPRGLGLQNRAAAGLGIVRESCGDTESCENRADYGFAETKLHTQTETHTRHRVVDKVRGGSTSE